MKDQSSTLWLLITTAIVGFITGCFVGDDSAEMAGLRSEVAKLQSESTNLRGLHTSPSIPRRLPPVPLPHPGTRAPILARTNSPAIPSHVEYIRQQKALMLSNIVSKTAAESKEEYSSVFSTLGLSTEDADRFRVKLVALHHKAVEAGEPLGELMQERYRYDEEIRKTLGEEKYKAYRSYEESKPAFREFKQIQEFSAKSKTVDLDPLHAAELIEIIKEAGATTTETWHGPYDPAPRPAVGREMLVPRLAEETQKLQDTSALVVQRVREMNLPDGYADLMRDYYDAKIQEKIDFMAAVNRPEEEILHERMREIEEEMAKKRTGLFP